MSNSIAYRNYRIDNNNPQLANKRHLIQNSNTIININDNISYERFAQITQKFFKVNILEIEPTTQEIEKNILEDLNILIDNLVNIFSQEINKGKEVKGRKELVYDYFNYYKINLQEIYHWLLNNQTFSYSIYLLGYFSYHGIGIEINKQDAFKLYQEAAELGDMLAQFELANMYINGNDIDKDYGKAFKLSKKLSEKNFSCGMNMLGYCYRFGVGTSTDLQKAFNLYQKAADLGNIAGMYHLGRCYKNGLGTNVNYEKAFALFQEAANYGISSAQYYLALMYKKGHGTEKDMILATYWYKKSTENKSKKN
ncbi:hypothetical protein RclHR1_10670003 [Rhizophagus clarus]|uniref:Kinase-like domain-containing protein n=1 Tax=Rhizophagus clarus TaxID=94130 RepID=A0A2Z6QGU0_9GLOM|nr:hypothetical protein RclHR1_10670003 [Rhizophagus clarus]GES91147.1 kinase-like domain-containing protein [Rhizophagus clarus]